MAPIFKSSHARYAVHTAGVLGHHFSAHDVDGYLFEVRDGAQRAFFSCAAGSPYALNPAHAYSIARDKAFTQKVLHEAGVPTVPSRLFFTNAEHEAMRSPGREPSDALTFAARAVFPLFAKPIDGARGQFAEMINDRGEFERYMQRVATKHYAVLVQPLIAAPELRVFVLQDRALFWYRKSPPTVLGDGVSSLAALAGHGPETLRGSDEGGLVYRAADIPPAGACITLAGAANRALGGGASAPEIIIPEPFAHVARACAGVLGLQLAAIDMFDAPDGPVVIEVNANPSIHTLEDHGRWDLIEAIWRANFDAALK